MFFIDRLAHLVHRRMHAVANGFHIVSTKPLGPQFVRLTRFLLRSITIRCEFSIFFSFCSGFLGFQQTACLFNVGFVID